MFFCVNCGGFGENWRSSEQLSDSGGDLDSFKMAPIETTFTTQFSQTLTEKPLLASSNPPKTHSRRCRGEDWMPGTNIGWKYGGFRGCFVRFLGDSDREDSTSAGPPHVGTPSSGQSWENERNLTRNLPILPLKQC